MRPRARLNGLAVEDLPDETLIYDLRRERAHCLNLVAGIVWRCCDGARSIDEIAEELERHFGQPIPERREVVCLALDRLQRARLLEGSFKSPVGIGRITRRQLIGNIVVVPVVLSIATPAAAFITTPSSPPPCRPTNSPCTLHSQCCSGICLSTAKCS